MSNSIYCSATHMKLVTGDAGAKSVRVRKFAELALPAGGMINGIITDTAIMTKFFAQANNDYALGKEPTCLVVNNNKIQAKCIEVPPVSEDMVLDFIRREYSQHGESEEGSEESVYDYAVLAPHGPNGGTEILAVGAPRELLSTYREVLVSAGFDLKQIDIGLNCQIKLSSFVPQLKQGSVLLGILDARVLALTLFENGHYQIANRHRLVHTENEPEWMDEIGGHISSMIQFNKTQKDSAAITAAYIAGVSETRVGALRGALGYLGIGIERLDISERVDVQSSAASEWTTFDAGNYILNIGNLLRG